MCIKIALLYYYLLQFSISHVQFRISITIFLVGLQIAHTTHPPKPFSSLRRVTAPFLLLVVRSVAATTFQIKTLDGLLHSAQSDLLYFGLLRLTWSGPLLLASTTLDLADIIAASSCKR